MKHVVSFFLSLFLISLYSLPMQADEPASGYLFAYGPNTGDGKGGLRFAWSTDSTNWYPIGHNHSFLTCDYGAWGRQKRLYDPVLIQGPDKQWHCLWTLNDEDGVVAYTVSSNLTYWKPQSYPAIFGNKGNCRLIETKYDAIANRYLITWVNTQGGNEIFGSYTKDFTHFEPATQMAESARLNQRKMIEIEGEKYLGTVHRVDWAVIDHLVETQKLTEYKNRLHNEKMSEDAVRFADLKPVEATITLQPEKGKKISDMLIGIFFEDINYAADGGLYAELVRNRDFEFSEKDRPEWNAQTAWKKTDEGVHFAIETASPIHENNKHYAVLEVIRPGGGIVNEGYDNIPLKKGEKYDFSLFARTLDGKKKKVRVRLVDANGKVFGEATTGALSANWKKHTGVITAAETVDGAQLEVVSLEEGKIALDMITLFPQNTFKGRKNGLRADLAQILADMKPRFVRFPGGCVAHGDGIENIYNWKNTIGPLESRKQDRNIWRYHQSMGLGYFEYFQFCEDLGAEPLPVLAAGVPCQNSSTGGHGQQCGIPMDQMDAYIQDILDLIEWANGDPKKSKWAKMRAEAGHPKPFNLKYIGIGNEDLISDVFEVRFVKIVKAIQEKYPDIAIVGTSGPFYEGSDYTEGWRIATETGIELVDEHYYVQPGWFIHNQEYYDRYDRSKPKVYLGEYAAHAPGRKSTLETALTEALHLANVERNGDIVALTSYAPLFGKEKNLQWSPDLIYFNNTEVKPTISYYVQQLYGQNSGDEYLPSITVLSEKKEDVRKRVACSVVRDTKTGDYIVKLLNLLPVEVNTTIDLSPLGLTNKHAVKTILQGQPADEKVKPATSTIQVSNSHQQHLPAYSFTILRIKQ